MAFGKQQSTAPKPKSVETVILYDGARAIKYETRSVSMGLLRELAAMQAKHEDERSEAVESFAVSFEYAQIQDSADKEKFVADHYEEMVAERKQLTLENNALRIRQLLETFRLVINADTPGLTPADAAHLQALWDEETGDPTDFWSAQEAAIIRDVVDRFRAKII